MIKPRKVKYFLWVDVYRAVCEQLEDSDSWTGVIPFWKHLVQYTDQTNQYAVHSTSLAVQRLLTETEVENYEVLAGPFTQVLNELSKHGDEIVVHYTVPL